MTVAELIGKLMACPMDAIVVMDLNDFSSGLWMAHSVHTQLMRQLMLEPECFIIKNSTDDEVADKPTVTVHLSPHK